MSYDEDVARVLAVVADLAGNRQRAIFWFYNQPLSVFDGRTADAVVREGRVEALVGYIESFESGFTG